MLKTNRKRIILEQVEQQEYVKVADLQKLLQVTEMTIRRDLHELEKEGALKRVHGGAKSIGTVGYTDLEHVARKAVNEDKKREIAQKAANLIQEGDIVFLSASTTNEFIYEYIQANNIRIITNCLYIYFQYMRDHRFDAILIGGKYDEKLESFLGTLTNDSLLNMNFTKAFVGTNGIYENQLSASNDEEGLLHRMALNNAKEKYVVCDTTKFNTEDFYVFYQCDKLTGIITNSKDFMDKEEYEKLTSIL